MKKCIGCGEILQIKDRDKKGYVSDFNKDYCFRCFKIKHYNELKLDLKNNIKKEDVLKLIEKIDATFVLIVDVLNIESSFDQTLLTFLKNKKVIIIISKCDLLPKSTNLDLLQTKILNYLAILLKGINVLEVILSSKNDYNFKIMFEDIIKEFNLSKLCFIGYSNVGKSSLINKLLEKELLTTSYFLTTTLNINEIQFDDYVIIDTPGFVDFNNAFAILNTEEIKKIVIKKTIKTKVYQLYQNQSYFVDDIFKIDVLTNQKSSVVFYMNNNLNIHRTNYLNADKYMNAHCLKLKNIEYDRIVYDLKNDENEIVINGIAIIKIFKATKVIILLHKQISTFIRKGII